MFVSVDLHCGIGIVQDEYVIAFAAMGGNRLDGVVIKNPLEVAGGAQVGRGSRLGSHVRQVGWSGKLVNELPTDVDCRDVGQRYEIEISVAIF